MKFENPIIGTIGICSGGYFSLRLKKLSTQLRCVIIISLKESERRLHNHQTLDSFDTESLSEQQFWG